MTLNSSNKDIIIKRRREVAYWRLRGLTLSEIADKIAKNKNLLNPRTGKPYSSVTIHNDIVALNEEWRAESLRDIAAYKSEQLAGIREARRKAWKDGSLTMIAKFLQMEIDLLGTDAPIKITWQEEAKAAGLDPASIFESLVNQYAAAITSGSG